MLCTYDFKELQILNSTIPLKKLLIPLKDNTVAVSMHKIGHFTPNILAYSRIPFAYSTLLFTGRVCGIFQRKMSVLQLVIPEKIQISAPTDRGNFHPPGRGRIMYVQGEGTI